MAGPRMESICVTGAWDREKVSVEYLPGRCGGGAPTKSGRWRLRVRDGEGCELWLSPEACELLREVLRERD